MKMTEGQGAGPITPDDGSCGRRIKQPTHQAGSPGSGTTHECPVDVAKELRRLSYFMRKNMQPPRIRRELCRLRFILAKPSENRPKRSGLAGKHKRAFPFPRDLRRRPVSFVAAKEDSTYTPAEYTPRARPIGGVMRQRLIPNLGYDRRFVNTPFEAPVLKMYRCAQAELYHGKRRAFLTREELSVMLEDPIMCNLTPGQYDPQVPLLTDKPKVWLALVPYDTELNLPTAKIGSYELAALMNSIKPRHKPLHATQEQVDTVIADAFAELQARLDNLANWKPIEKPDWMIEAGW